MLTIFSTPKPFAGHIDVIQRNAVRSWQRLHPDIEIILVGDDAGTAEVCTEFGIRHIRTVRRNDHGTKYLADIYVQAQQAARHKILCHVNCDIILRSDFSRGVRLVSDATDRFLMAGCRWDVDIQTPLDFDRTGWEDDLERLARRMNRQRPPEWIDYFVFSKGLYDRQIPEFVVGRPGWDNWLLWYPLSIKAPVVDASRMVMAIHQNHDYSYHPDGEKGVWHGAEAQENYRLHHGKFATLANATYVLRSDGLRRNRTLWVDLAKRRAVGWFYRVWFGLLNATRPIRRHLGMHKNS